jgi:hypothetical protein
MSWVKACLGVSKVAFKSPHLTWVKIVAIVRFNQLLNSMWTPLCLGQNI